LEFPIERAMYASKRSSAEYSESPLAECTVAIFGFSLDTSIALLAASGLFGSRALSANPQRVTTCMGFDVDQRGVTGATARLKRLQEYACR
jgi:hypothetical protein